MRIAIAALAGVLCLAACASEPPGGMRNMNRAVELKGYPAYSWGLAGVTMEHYDDVAIECTARTVFNPVDPRSANFVLSTNPDGTPDDFTVRMAAHEELAREREERRQRQALMDNCLAEFGFVKFGLTEEQVRVLETLPRGNPERRRYLHGLGSDPEILARQRI
jgi:hypothetical protein